MSPTNIELAARDAYNAIGDTFFSQSSIMTLIYRACSELAQKAKVIERTYVTTSVANQQQYDYPTNTISISGVEYNGVELEPIDRKDRYFVDSSNSTSTMTGAPRFYSVWNNIIYLSPTPAAAGDTIRIFSFNRPQEITTTSTLEVPEIFHTDIVDYVVSEMAAKSQAFEAASYYRNLWKEAVEGAVSWQAKRKRGNKMAVAKRDEGCW